MREALAEFRRDVEVVESGYESVDRGAPCPRDLARIPRPIVGYAGNLSARIDVALLRGIAERHPEWSIVLIGAARPDAAIHALADLPNVHLLGVRPHAEIGAYVRHFDVAIVPHVDDALTRSMSPLKIGLYCAAGVPVVSTRVANLGAARGRDRDRGGRRRLRGEGRAGARRAARAGAMRAPRRDPRRQLLGVARRTDPRAARSDVGVGGARPRAS